LAAFCTNQNILLSVIVQNSAGRPVGDVPLLLSSRPRGFQRWSTGYKLASISRPFCTVIHMRDSLTIVGTIAGLVVGFLTAYFTHRWSQGRLLEDRRDDLRLNLYLELLKASAEHHRTILKISSLDCLTEFISFAARLNVLGSKPVVDAYSEYLDALMAEIEGDRDPGGLIDDRDAIVAAMANDFNRSSTPLTAVLRRFALTTSAAGAEPPGT
jgi:hypothetical protein